MEKLVKSSLFSILILSVPGLVFAETIKLGYSAIAGNQLPAWVAKDAGIFDKNGLDVQLVHAEGNVAVLGLLSGNFAISQVAGPAVVNSALKGSDVAYVAGGMTSLNYYLMVRPEIKSPEQLKRKIVAISRFGSASDFITQLALERIGLKAGKDVVIVQMGDAPRRIEAAMANQIQGVVLDPPANVIAEKRGMVSLVNLAEQGLIYQHTGAVTTRRYIREHPDIVRRYVKSQVEAVHRIYTDKETSVKVLVKYFGENIDRDILEATWKNLADERILPRKQYPSAEGIKTIMESQSKGVDPASVIDSRFIRELDESGYIDRLYKNK
jgi:NitT/TauT family transport system substrate-binding protein